MGKSVPNRLVTKITNNAPTWLRRVENEHEFGSRRNGDERLTLRSRLPTGTIPQPAGAGIEIGEVDIENATRLLESEGTRRGGDGG